MSEPSSAEGPVAVIKLGGSILTSARAYRRAAIFVRNTLAASPDERLVVVVSAQEGTTDSLERSARGILHKRSNLPRRVVTWFSARRSRPLRGRDFRW
jgi:aspartokinase